MKFFVTLLGLMGLLLLTPSFALAQKSDSKRSVELELEEVEGATGYEIELTSKSSDKVQSFKMKKPLWKASIRPGDYKLKLRSFDERGVPGSWSEDMPFTVKLPGTTLLSPVAGTEIKTNEEKKYDVELKWAAVPGTKKYRVDVAPEGATPETAGEVVSETFSENAGKITLPVAKKYQWTVVSISKSGEEGEKQDSPGTFTLIGKALETPEIEKPEDIWVQNLKWNKPDFAEKFDYVVQRKTPDGKWEKVEGKTDFVEQQIPFPIEYPGGDYRLGVKAESTLREPSKIALMPFEVSGGDRSPAAVEEAKLRHSLDKPTPWYFIASWMYTNVQYTGSNPQGGYNPLTGAAKSHTYDTPAGTGRLGIGYIHPKRNSGFLGIIDMSGLTVAGSNVTYASAELHYLKRYTWGRNMFRPSAGLFYRELPETRSNFNSGALFSENLAYAGPHLGFDFWRPLTSKLGFQANMRVYMGAIDMGTPNGQAQEPEGALQIGVMGSYKIKPNITGFMGWAHREDRSRYKSLYDGNPLTTDPDIAGRNQYQDITISGDYINFLLEWGF